MKYTMAVNLGQNGLLRKIPDTDYFQIMEEFYWYVDYETKQIKVTVPIGFITNFGSIPYGLRSVFSPTKYVAYILHDYLYSKMGSDLGRYGADVALLNALRVEGANIAERYLIFFGVRVGGILFYKNK